MRAIISPSGGTVDLLSTSTYNAGAINPATVIVSLVPPTTPNFTLFGNILNVPAGLAEGAYQAQFSVCQRSIPSNCGTATAFVSITLTPSSGTPSRPPTVPGTGTSTGVVTLIGPSGSPITFNTGAAASSTAGGITDPLTFSDVKIVFGQSETGKVQAFYRQNDKFEPFGAQLNYSGAGTIRGRWEVVYPNDPLPTEIDLFPEASLPLTLRLSQQRFFQIARLDAYLQPIGRYFLKGPDPALLPRNIPGQYLVLLRLESVGTGAEGGRSAFAFPVLRYFVQEAPSNVGSGESGSGIDGKSKTPLQGKFDVTDFSNVGVIGRGSLNLDSSSLKIAEPGQGFVGVGPKPISLTLPQDGASMAGKPVQEFSWADIDGAAQFIFELGSASGQSFVVSPIKPGVGKYTLPTFLLSQLPKGTLVRWRVLALNSGGRAVGASLWRTIRFE